MVNELEKYKDLTREELEMQLDQKEALVTNLATIIGRKEVENVELGMDVALRNNVIAQMSQPKEQDADAQAPAEALS